MKFHVTDLDQMIWYRKIESMTKEDLVGRLLRTEPANDQMKMGTAWHDILENPPSDSLSEAESGGFTFKVECDGEIILPQIREIRAEKTYTIGNDKVTLAGKCDGITGNKVTDHKLTFRPNPETYFDSYQWRAYLDIFNADVFEYIIYHGAKKKPGVVIKDVSTLTMYRYPGMVKDLESGIRELVQFAKEYLPRAA